jgi:hypothetical protein
MVLADGRLEIRHGALLVQAAGGTVRRQCERCGRENILET